MEEILKFIAGTGVAGCILAYFLHTIKPTLENITERLEKRMYDVEQAITRQSKAELMRICVSPSISPEVKEKTMLMIQEHNEVLDRPYKVLETSK